MHDVSPSNTPAAATCNFPALPRTNRAVMGAKVEQNVAQSFRIVTGKHAPVRPFAASAHPIDADNPQFKRFKKIRRFFKSINNMKLLYFFPRAC
jgi:hypothetical protein